MPSVGPGGRATAESSSLPQSSLPPERSVPAAPSATATAAAAAATTGAVGSARAPAEGGDASGAAGGAGGAGGRPPCDVSDDSVTPATTPLPAGWSAHKDPDTGLSYYFHAASGTSTWELPEGGAGGGGGAGEAEGAGAGREDVFEDAREPEAAAAAGGGDVVEGRSFGGGWTEHLDPDSGMPYYYHSQSGKSQWERP